MRRELTPAPQQPELWDELKVEHHWFHVVRAMIVRDKIAQMGVNAWAVYCVLKAYTQLDDGRTWPSQARIADHIGLSVDTVARATDRLIELGLVEKRKVGRRSEYSLVEEVPLSREGNGKGEVVATAAKTYSPMGFQSYIEELKAFAKNGKLDPSSGIQITLNVNFIQQGDHGVVNVQQVTVTDADGQTAPGLQRLQDQIRKLKLLE